MCAERTRDKVPADSNSVFLLRNLIVGISQNQNSKSFRLAIYKTIAATTSAVCGYFSTKSTITKSLKKNLGCPKSHCTKVRAHCSACDHLICKISSGMFHKSSSFEEFNGFSEIDVHFFE